MRSPIKSALACLLLFCASLAWGADYAVKSFSISTNGWDAYIVFENMGTNGTWSFGLGALNTIAGNETITLTITSMGYDDACNPTTVVRKVYGTKQVRYPYPYQASTDIGYTNTVDCIARIALSDYVHTNDSNITVTIKSGLYTQGGHASLATTDLPVQNLSIIPYPKCVGKFSDVPYRRSIGNTTRTRFVCWQKFGDQGRPVRAVKVWATDGSNYSATNIVTSFTIDSTYGDASPVIEGITDIDTTALNTTNLIYIHFQAYPWIGDSGSILDTSDGRYSAPAYGYCADIVFLDRTNQWGGSIAVVDSTTSGTGNDSTGVAVTAASFDAQNPPAKFATMAGALTAIVRSNWTFYSHADPGSGFIYLTAGDHKFAGGTPTLTNRPSTYVTIATIPGVDRTSCVITGSVTAKSLDNMYCLSNVTISSQTSPTTFNNASNAWFDRCIFTNCTDAALLRALTNVYITRSRISSLPQGFVPYNGVNMNVRLVRGNDISDLSASGNFPTTYLGNVRNSGTNGSFKVGWPTTTTQETADYPIIAYNRFYCENAYNGGNIIELFPYSSSIKGTNGFALVQNIIEQVAPKQSAAVRIFSICQSSQNTSYWDTNDVNNAIVWHNTGVGQRGNINENASGSSESGTNAIRFNWSYVNNLFDNPNPKSDNFAPNPSSNNIGNWAFMYGAGNSGNTDLDPVNMDPGWFFDFIGLNSYCATNTPTNLINYAHFTRRSAGFSQDNDPLWPGFGDYTLQSDSPVKTLAMRWVLPYDIAGVARYTNGALGAYEYGVTNAATSTVRRPVVSPSRGRRR